MRQKHPRLITCDISGYGEGGPYENMKAYDLLIQAETGVAAVTGSPDAPGRVGISVVDLAAGIHAYAAIAEALFARERTGEGRAVAVSLFHTMADWMNVPLFHNDLAGNPPERVGLRHPSIAPYGLFHCAGGEPIVIAIQNAREWPRLCETVLERPDMASDPRFADNPARLANRPALEAEMGAILGRLPREEAIRRLEAAQIAYGRVNSVADLSAHPELRRVSVDTPNGPAQLVPPGALVRELGPLQPGAVPALDEHGRGDPRGVRCPTETAGSKLAIPPLLAEGEVGAQSAPGGVGAAPAAHRRDGGSCLGEAHPHPLRQAQGRLLRCAPGLPPLKRGKEIRVASARPEWNGTAIHPPIT